MRRQSEAATALWAARGSLVLAERSAGPTPKRRRASLAAALQNVTDNLGMHGGGGVTLWPKGLLDYLTRRDKR